MLANNRLKVTGRLFFAERPQLSWSVRCTFITKMEEMLGHH